jgi:tetratricopeptide (TPR) repeat protein
MHWTLEAQQTLTRLNFWRFLVLVAVWFAPGSATASTQSAEGRSVLAEPEYVTLRSAWYEVQAALSREEWSEAQGRLLHVQEVKTDLGLPNVFELSAVLLRAAGRASDAGADDVALSFAESAANLSPDLSIARFEQAAYSLDEDVFELPEALKHLRHGYELLGSDPHGVSVFIANLLSGATLLSLLMLFVFVAVNLVRYGECFVRDMQRVARKSIDRFQGWLLFVVLAFTPLVLGLGLVVTASVWLIVFAAYNRRSGRFVTLLILCAVGFLGIFADVIDRATAYPSSEEAVIYRCNTGLCNQQDRLRLASMAGDKRHAYEAAYTLALLEIRSLSPSESQLVRARRSIEAAWTVTDTWQARVLHGNIAYAQAMSHCEDVLAGNLAAKDRYEVGLEEARGYWQLAEQQNANSVEAHYNLGITAQLLGEVDEASERSREASRIAPRRVVQFQSVISDGRTEQRCSYWSQPNRHVMTPAGPFDDLYGGYFEYRGEGASLAAPLSALLSGSVGTSYVGYVGFGGAGLVFILLFLAPFAFISRPCEKCPSVAEPASRVNVIDGAVCSACVLADVGRGVVDAKSQWRREQLLEVRRARRLRLQQLVTWLLPGFAAAIAGRPVRGMVTSAFFLGCLLWATDMHIITDHVHRVAGPSMGRVFPLIVLAGVVYIVSLVRVHRRGVTYGK